MGATKLEGLVTEYMCRWAGSPMAMTWHDAWRIVSLTCALIMDDKRPSVDVPALFCPLRPAVVHLASGRRLHRCRQQVRS